MNRLTLKQNVKAIEKSIEHWWQNIQLTMLYYMAKIPRHEWHDIEISWKTCPLCHLYTNKEHHTTCSICPITEFNSMCDSSTNPWSKVADELSSFPYFPITIQQYNQLYLAMKNEICFLYDLLDFVKKITIIKRIQKEKSWK